MSAYSDYLAKQKAFNDRDDAAVTKLVTSVDGLSADFENFRATIKKLQDSAGQVTPEDQALIDQLQSQGDAFATKLEGVSTALATLDESEPPAPPATV